MIVYITGSTFNQVIQNSIEEADALVFLSETSNEVDFSKFVKLNITKFDNIDILIVDISVTTNTDEEIIQTMEMLRTMYDKLKIIILAAYRPTGNQLLVNCFRLGIHNIINTDDFLEIRQELLYCIQTGKTFKDAIKYKEEKAEKVVVKHEIKKTVNKKLIGIAGTESNIGVTHNAIVMANYLRSKGFMVALVEMNKSGAFGEIQEDFEERIFNEGYFTLNGVDFYKNWSANKLVDVMGKSYNFILLDFGEYMSCDRVTYERCEERFIIAGSKSWETEKVNSIFSNTTKESLIQYHFCFNFTPEKDVKAIREGMGEIKKVYFLKYTEDPFESSNLNDGDIIFSKYLPDRIEEEPKKGFFKKRKKS